MIADAQLIATALAYARAAGFEVAEDPQAIVDGEDAPFATADLRRVMLQQRAGDLPISIFLDDVGAVRAVEDVIYQAPMGDRVSEARALRLAGRYLADVGIDRAFGSLHVALTDPDAGWYITLDREIEGHPVANQPMGWWVDGDKVYIAMRPDGLLWSVYAVPVDTWRPNPEPLDATTLEKALAAFADRPRREIRDLDLGLSWVQPRYGAPDGVTPTLVLGYCATDRHPLSWEAWCVDAGTGAPIARGSGSD